jgi:hypothetical protein
MKPTEERFRQVFNTVEPHIERRYGVPVVIGDVVNPFTGDLNGAEIRIDYELSPEEAVFILVHLFGHTVQWNISEYAREVGGRVFADPTPTHLDELNVYEREACRYSLQLFHDAGVNDLDQWLADFHACDFAYLRHFYAKKEKLPFYSFWREGQALLEPLPIPEFTPTKWVSRWQGTVV